MCMLHLPGLYPLVTSTALDILPLWITGRSHWPVHKKGGLLQTNVCLYPLLFCLFKEIGIFPTHSRVHRDTTKQEHALLFLVLYMNGSLISQGQRASHFRRCPETTVIHIIVILQLQVRLGPLCNVSMAIRHLTFYLNYQSRMTLQPIRGRLDPKISLQEPMLTQQVRSIINFHYFRFPVPAGANTSQNMSSLQLLPVGLPSVTYIPKSFQGLGF